MGESAVVFHYFCLWSMGGVEEGSIGGLRERVNIRA